MSYEQDVERQNEQLQSKLDEALETIENLLMVDAVKTAEITFLQKQVKSLEDVGDQYKELVAKYKKMKRTMELLQNTHKANKIHHHKKLAETQIDQEEREQMYDEW